jgi:hypothetical protein
LRLTGRLARQLLEQRHCMLSHAVGTLRRSDYRGRCARAEPLACARVNGETERFEFAPTRSAGCVAVVGEQDDGRPARAVARALFRTAYDDFMKAVLGLQELLR